MEEKLKENKKYLELLLMIGEVLVAIIIIVTVIIASFQTFILLGSMVKVSIPDKSDILDLIDLAILLLLALDLLRTVIIGILEKEIPIKNIIEAALIVIVREMIVNTLMTSSPIYLVYLSLSFVMVAVSMIFLEKYSKS